MSCMLCRKCDIVLFNVNSNHGKYNQIFKELFADKVTPYLNDDSCICSVCINILDNILTIITCFWSIISDSYSQPQLRKLNKLRKIFASFKFDGDDIEHVQLQDYVRIPTPNLMVPSFSVPYLSNLEGQIAEIERLKSLSSNNIQRPETDTSEVQKILSNKRRRGSKGRSRSLTSSGYGRSKAYSRETTTPCSEYSTWSSYTDKSASRRIPAKRTSTTCTRPISRALAKQQEKCLNDNIVYCSVPNCNMFSDDIEEINIHNTEEHQMVLKYHCYECSNVYSSENLLKHHMKQHNFSFFCLMCGVEQQNTFELQTHLDEHMIYSVPCKYCDKSFLSKATREQHKEKCHKSRRTRRIYKKKLIMDRIDKEDINTEKNCTYKKNYESRYLFYTDMEYEEGDLDMTIDNLKTKDIPIYTDEDEGITSEDFGEECNENVNSIDLQIENETNDDTNTEEET